ncbi:MAG TPA: hypothetical protein VFJ58_25820 [Armatimonadota bacterium]|nr:hypothetical protein [Armatimonadota bacterium]
MSVAETMIALICVIGGAALQWRSRAKGALDMQILGAMLWLAGLVLLMDCHWHFLTEPEH